jgi:hypothetical protein
MANQRFNSERKKPRPVKRDVSTSDITTIQYVLESLRASSDLQRRYSGHGGLFGYAEAGSSDWEISVSGLHS